MYSAKKIETLRAITENRVTASCRRYVWSFTLDAGRSVTGTVKALEMAKLIKISYYAGNSAAINLTEEGRATLARARF